MYTLAFVSAALQSTTDDGLHLGDLFDSLPTDPVSLAVLGMLAASVALVLWAGRGKGKGGKAA
jgi:hypothetical protein